MGFDHGRIVFERTNRIYYAGEIMRGKVVFNQEKKKSFTGIYAKLKGVCDVHWTSGSEFDRGGRTHHTSHEKYVDQKVYLIGGPNGDVHIQPGHYEYPFTLTIPSHCPPSFEGPYGHIKYTVKVAIERLFKFDQEKTVAITVLNPKDLNMDPYCREPMLFEFEETYCCWCSSQGMCETTVKLPQSGYCPGQTINFELKCTNNSSVEMDLIMFQIIETRKYKAVHNSDSKNAKDVIATMTKGPVHKHTTRNWSVAMEIPQLVLFNLDACKYIDIRYDFKVKILVNSGCHLDASDRRQLVLGHIPLREFGGPPQAAQIVAQPVATTLMPFPTNNGTYSAENGPYSNKKTPYPGGNPPYPVATAPYSGANSLYPPNQPCLGTNPPYPPGQNPPCPGPYYFPSPSQSS
ncbi:hypothetical protein O0L34_g15290 [Tuta absoluta]|nr:hypothetical protein O0L34_g15290 [Tuta absoluta]